MTNQIPSKTQEICLKYTLDYSKTALPPMTIRKHRF